MRLREADNFGGEVKQEAAERLQVSLSAGITSKKQTIETKAWVMLFQLGSRCLSSYVLMLDARESDGSMKFKFRWVEESITQSTDELGTKNRHAIVVASQSTFGNISFSEKKLVQHLLIVG